MSKRYYGPYKINKKINDVAYQLELPKTSSIFPVFHISLLKKFVGNLEEGQQLALPPTIWDAHPVVVPASVSGYRVITRKGYRTEQVLVS